METPKTLKLLNNSDNEYSKLAARKRNVINGQNRASYGKGNGNDENIKFETKVIILSLWDYSDAYILVTGDIIVTGINTKLKH